MSWLISGIAAFISGLIGSMGMGGGGVLIIYLTLIAKVPQSTAQGINLLFFLPTAALAVIYYTKKKMIDWRYVFPLSFLGTLGTVLGSGLCGRFDNSGLTKLFGIFLLFMGVVGIFKKENPSETEGRQTGYKI